MLGVPAVLGHNNAFAASKTVEFDDPGRRELSEGFQCIASSTTGNESW